MLMLATTNSCLARQLTMGVTLVLGLSAALTTANDSVPKAASREEAWNVIYLSGQRIGYSQTVIENVVVDGKAMVKTSAVANMVMKRFGQTLVLNQHLTTEESATGELREFRLEMSNPPAAPTVTRGKVEGTQLMLTQEVNGKAKTTPQPWRADVKSPAYQDRLLKSNPMKAGETRSFELYSPEFAKIGTVTLKGIGSEEVTLLNKESRQLFKVVSSQSLLPGITTDSFLDEAGETLKTSSSILGSAMEMYQVSELEARKIIESAELDLAITTLIKVKPIPKGHETTKVVYRVTIKGQNPVDVIPVGDTQSIQPRDAESADLTVISMPIPPTAKVQQLAPEFLESSQYLQRDDERVKQHADQAAGDATDPAEIARKMERYVYQNLDKKNFSTAMASAGEVARTLEGDCTEHAVLLAAMLRAKGIPSRVAVGLVYADRLRAFGGHMWTEANLNGHWIPLDATLAQGGIGAAHIKLADASLSDSGPPAISGFASLMTVIGKLKLEILSAE